MTQSIASRVVKAVNITIAVLLAVSAALVAWYVLRPLPQRSGTVDAPIARRRDCEFRYARRTAHPRGERGGRLLRPGLRDRAGPVVADGRAAAVLGRFARRDIGTEPAGKRPRVPQTADAAHRGGRLRHAAGRGPRGVRRLHSRREPLHRHPPEQPSGGIHAAQLPAAALERGGLPAAVPPHVPQPDHHVEGRNRQEQHAGAGRPCQGGIPVSDARTFGCQSRLQ